MDLLQIYNYFLFFGIIQFTILGIVLVLKRRKGFPNLFLCLFYFFVLLYFLDEFFHFLAFIGDLRLRVSLETFLNLLPAPFLFLYCQRINEQQFRLKRIEYKYFLFAFISAGLILFVFVSGYLFQPPKPEMDRIFRIYHILLTLLISTQSYLFFGLITRMVAQKSGYLFLQTLRVIRIRELRYQWLRFFIFVFFLHATINLANGLVMLVDYSNHSGFVLISNGILFVVIGIASSFFFVSNPFILHINKWKSDYQEINKYERSPMDRDEALHCLRRMNEYMEKQRPYLNKSLTQAMLSDETGVPVHQISQVVNGLLNQNFFDYVNNFRVEEFKRLLREDRYPTFTLTGVAFEAGFNSRTTFHTAFKKITGMTPSEYKKSNNTH